ncbi:hypothetical protein [Bacillus cereus]|uniref:hypothetical protein n=1 Tax=Bacillus cereus TaxID=1396 RepID=UPI00403AA631
MKTRSELTGEIKKTFYEEYQGITLVAVNLFILAQERALFDVWSNTESLYVACLGEGDISAQFKTLKDTEETSSNTTEELIQFSGTEDLPKDEKKYINYVAKDTLDFQNTKSKIFDLMGNVVDNPNKLNDSTWKQ